MPFSTCKYISCQVGTCSGDEGRQSYTGIKMQGGQSYTGKRLEWRVMRVTLIKSAEETFLIPRQGGWDGRKTYSMMVKNSSPFVDRCGWVGW